MLLPSETQKNGNDRKIKIVVRIISLCLILQLIISRNLWIMDWRSFPAVPLFSFFPVHLGGIFGFLLFALIFIACVTLLFSPLQTKAAVAIPVIFFLFVLEDVTRLQPWVYLYSAMLLLLFFLGKAEKQHTLLLCWKILFSGVYFWSGIQKINPHFAGTMFPWLAGFAGGENFLKSHHWVAYTSAGIEALAAIGLWFHYTRKPAIITILCVHAFILLVLGPLGHNWNEVVWPWNIAFACINTLIFSKPESVATKQEPSARIAIAVSLFLFAVYPSLSLINRADHFLSAGYYSNVASSAIIYMSPPEAEKFPPQARKHMFEDTVKKQVLLLPDHWALEELKVPFYPEDRTHIQLMKIISPCIQDKENSGMRILQCNRFSKLKKEQVISLSSLPPQSF